jgi:hypothetical protein
MQCYTITTVNEKSKKIKNYLRDFEFFLQDGQINEFVLHPHAIHCFVFPKCFVLSEL